MAVKLCTSQCRDIATLASHIYEESAHNHSMNRLTLLNKGLYISTEALFYVYAQCEIALTMFLL